MLLSALLQTEGLIFTASTYWKRHTGNRFSTSCLSNLDWCWQSCLLLMVLQCLITQAQIHTILTRNICFWPNIFLFLQEQISSVLRKVHMILYYGAWFCLQEARSQSQDREQYRQHILLKHIVLFHWYCISMSASDQSEHFAIKEGSYRQSYRHHVLIA